jgi:hypothetical protein
MTPVKLEQVILKKLLYTILFEREKMQYGNDYVFGSDDCIRIINNLIK